MPTAETDTDYRLRLEAESRKWGNHLQIEASGIWNSWLDHPLVVGNYQRRGLVDGLRWEEWVRHRLGGPARRCLDLGCGAGDKSFAVHAAGSASWLEGYDVSGPRVACAEERRLASGIPGLFQVGDVNRLALPADSYDLIFSNHSFHHFLDLEHVMEQVDEALTPGGFFILEEFVGPTQFQWTDEQMALVRTRLSLIPERLRISSASGVAKFAEGRPTVEQVVAESPFESIRSAEIAPLFKKFFNVVAVRPLGGTLQQLLYNGIVQHFALEDPEAVRHVQGILALENGLIDAGLLPSDFMLLIGQRKTGAARTRTVDRVRSSSTERRRAGRTSTAESRAAATRHWHIGICGTFDVANYGDLLFPLMAEAELAERLGGPVTLHRFSYNPKTPPHWPYKVTSVAELPHLVHRLDGMLIGGGFLIRFDKEVAPGYSPPDPGIHHPTGYWLTPALLALQHDVPLVWNAPGMHRNEIPTWAAPLMKMALSLSRYVSVRDEPSAEVLERVGGTSVAVVPDTAFRIARLLNLDDKPSAEFTRLSQAAGLEAPYIVIQAASGSEGFVRFAKRHAAELDGYRFLALPIGPVLGEDVAIIDADLPGLVRLPVWPHPLVIAELIARSEGVVGHSYHLFITALAAGVPIFTRQDLTEGKYTALRPFETIHSLPADGEPDVHWFLSRLGRGEPSRLLRATCDPLMEHWDRIAEALQAGADAPKTSPALNHFWQRLPNLLEGAGPGNGTVPGPGRPLADPGREDAIRLLTMARRENAETQRRLDEALRLLGGAYPELASPQDRPAETSVTSTSAIRERQGSRMINLEGIRNHRLETDPFEWAFIQDLFRPDHAERLAATYPCDHFKLLSAQGGEKDYEYEARSLIGMGAKTIAHQSDLSEAWQALALDLLSPEYRAAMTALTGCDLTEAPMEVNVFHFGPGCSLGSHCDLPDKVVTHVLYFNRAWNPKAGGCLNILRSADLADLAAEIPPLVGNSAVIVRSDHSWHAVPRVVSDSLQSRRSVTVTFYRPGAESSMWPPNDPTPLHRYHAADLA